MLTIYIVNIPNSSQKHHVLRSHLDQVFKQSGMTEVPVGDLQRTESGKLRMGEYFVNLTYADKYAFVLLTKERCGLDAETVKPQSHSVKTLLSSILVADIYSDMDFAKAWTSMEAEVKYYGDKELFDALNGRLVRNPLLKTQFLLYENNIIALTSYIDTMNERNIKFRKI